MLKIYTQSSLAGKGAAGKAKARRTRCAEMAAWVGVHEKDTMLIPLGKNLFAKVDANMHAFLDQWNWSRNKNGYVVRFDRRRLISMQEMVLTNCNPPFQRDHRNRDRLDNRIANLRPATRRQNQGNRWKSKHATSSQFKGVCFLRDGAYSAFRAYGREGAKNKCLGSFKSEIEAARAYNRWANSYFGEFAMLNPV